MESTQRFIIRCMKPDEAGRVNELIISLQLYQKMTKCPRLPNKQDTFEDLVRKEENSNKLVSNHLNTFTAVAVDMSRLNEPNQAYIVGYLVYTQAYSIIRGRNIFMTSFFIQEDYRRHGLGRKFIEYLRVHCLSADNRLIHVPFMNNNQIGQMFYKNFGAQLCNEEYQIISSNLDLSSK